MTAPKITDDLQTLLATDDMSDAEFVRLLAFVPAGKVAAVFERVTQMLSDVAVINGLNPARQFGR
ncbi:MAG: hypothetical protein HXX19_20785 [Rhodoferax sp.]|nr:hypothetical protein [Rhodoferax sp.]